MNGIRPIFKNITDELKTQFETSQCLLLISVGQEAHEGERFSSTIDLINTSFIAVPLIIEPNNRYVETNYLDLSTEHFQMQF